MGIPGVGGAPSPRDWEAYYKAMKSLEDQFWAAIRGQRLQRARDLFARAVTKYSQSLAEGAAELLESMEGALSALEATLAEAAGEAPVAEIILEGGGALGSGGWTVVASIALAYWFLGPGTRSSASAESRPWPTANPNWKPTPDELRKLAEKPNGTRQLIVSKVPSRGLSKVQIDGARVMLSHTRHLMRARPVHLHALSRG